MRRALRPLPAALLLIALIGIWEVYVDLKGGSFSTAILPAPHQVAKSLNDDRALLWSNFLVTAKEVLLGILVAPGRFVGRRQAMRRRGRPGTGESEHGGEEQNQTRYPFEPVCAIPKRDPRWPRLSSSASRSSSASPVTPATACS